MLMKIRPLLEESNLQEILLFMNVFTGFIIESILIYFMYLIQKKAFELQRGHC